MLYAGCIIVVAKGEGAEGPILIKRLRELDFVNTRS